MSPTDSVSNDSIKISSPRKDSLDAPIKYNAVDSFRFDIKNKKIYLFGDAEVDYKDIVLTADYIEFDWGNNVVTAIGTTDSSGKIIGKPHFKQGDDDYESNKIMYNFKTKKGKILDLITQEGDGYIQVQQAKKDSNDAMYAKNAIYSTCDLAHPHFYIKASKIQVIKDKVIVSGPASLVIEDIPTPLFVPFAIFPIKKGRTSGIIFPEYGEDRSLGFFLKNGGYYFAVNDNFDLALRGDIYSRGSWRVNVATNYVKKYKYSGGLSFSYARTINVDPYSDYQKVKQNDFKINWTYNQEPKAHPHSRFNINVNAGTSGYDKLYSYSFNNRLNNTYNSSISYHKDFKGTPFHLDLQLGHSQNTSSHTINFNLPTGSLNMDRLTPFKRKNQIGAVRWYEKIGLSYRAEFQNTLATTDSKLDDSNILSEFKNGFHHSVPLSTSFQILKYLNVSPSVNYNGYFYFKTIRKSWNSIENKMDTTTVNGFRSANLFDGNIGLSTKVYAMYSFKKGKLKAIRHVMTPNITGNFHPDYGSASYGYYHTVQRDSLYHVQQYSIFDDGVYHIPAAGKSGTMFFSLDNNIEAKVFSKKDTINHTKKIPLLDGLSVGSGYNFAVDSFQWQNFRFSARENILNRFNLTGSADYDPYKISAFGDRVDTLYVVEGKGKIARLTNANFSANTSFGSKQKKYASAQGTKEELDMINKNPDAFVDFNIPWKLNVGYNFNYRPKNPVTGDTAIFTQTLHFSGELNITSKWKISFQTNYDFKLKQFAYTTLEIYRDLHCWEMSFRWVPFGEHQSYSFDLRVKSSVLQSLKVSKRKSWNEYY